MLTARIRCGILLACACAIAAAKKVAVNADASTSKPLPTPHRQFTTRIETTAHQLNATEDYPPYKRLMTVRAARFMEQFWRTPSAQFG